MTIALALTTDGRREYIGQTIESLLENVNGIDGPFLLFDDSGDDEYRRWLRRFDGFEIIGAGPRRGQDRAVRRAWRRVSRLDVDYVFWCEDDFRFWRDVDLTELAAALEEHPHLAQMALLRQPWFAGERRAGGIVERDPDEYELVSWLEHTWLEHRLWFTLNPSLIPSRIFELERPGGRKHEWRFSRQLCRDPETRFAYWGTGEPWIEHIGERKAT